MSRKMRLWERPLIKSIFSTAFSLALISALVPTGSLAGPAAAAAQEQGAVAISNESAEYIRNAEGQASLLLQADAATDRRVARKALKKLPNANELVSDTFSTLDVSTADDSAASSSSSLDGSNVDELTARWITEDTEDNGDDSLLYLKPSGNSSQSATLRLNFALSGEHDYSAGDVVIKIPASLVDTRTGKTADKVSIPYPKDPNAKQAWNWKKVGDSYLITNTRTMSAATQGFMDIKYHDITPFEVVDMEVSNDFIATIEVNTHLGNTMEATSNKLNMVIDTESVITNATKRSRSVDYVFATQIPQGQRQEGVDEYIVVTWIMNPSLKSTNNTAFTLGLVDNKTDEYSGFIINDRAINVVDSDTATANVYSGSTSSSLSSSYTTVKVAYPLDQFEPNNTYTFTNDVDYTLIESDNDPNDPDGQKVTNAHASGQVSWTYSDPVYKEPVGHFNVFKSGNDNDGKATQHYPSDSTTVQTDVSAYSMLQRNGYYGLYPTGLNDIQDGSDVSISYTLESDGYLFPWTYSGQGDYKAINNYGKKNVKMVTTDTGLSANGDTLQVGTDYVYESVEFPVKPGIWKATALNLTDDGQFTTHDDGTVTYVPDNSNYKKVPVITLQLQYEEGGEWHDYATADWTSGKLKLAAADGVDASIKDGKVALPENTYSFRTCLESNVAAVVYYTRANVRLSAEGYMKTYADQLFGVYDAPTANVVNGVNMVACDADDKEIVSLDKTGYDKLRGYTTETRAEMSKSAQVKSVSYDDYLATVHYRANVHNSSFIGDKVVYEQAVADGALNSVYSGTWYDLLPKGMNVDLTTVRLRSGDLVKNSYTIDNYRGSGRTLLVVEGAFSPQTSQYSDGGATYYRDSLSIDFDAIIPFNSLSDFGETLHNVAAFSADNDYLGSVEGYVGEADNTSGTNNFRTSDAFADDTEKEALNDLVADNDNPSVLYAGVSTNIGIQAAAQTSINKEVMVNNDGWWSTGVYDGNESANARNVYEGGNYSYRLTMGSASNTNTSGIIVYDLLENFHAADGNDSIDINAPRWQGSLVGVDVSPLEKMGIAPVVYYSNVENMKLSIDMDNGIVEDEKNTDLTNSEVWTRADEYTGDLKDVKAVAIDLSKNTDGSDFILRPEQTVSAYLNMKAPQGEAAADYIEADAHAYNNLYSHSVVNQVDTGIYETNFIRKDYTKVGLSEYGLIVDKYWDDADDQDGLRPDSVVVTLYKDGKKTDESIELKSDEEGKWSGSFRHLPYSHDDGSKIVYTVRDSVSGYTYGNESANSDGTEVKLTNRHVPETIDINGVKRWIGDNEDLRPSKVKVDLYADGNYFDSTYATVNSEGGWDYRFDGLPKYRDHGTEIKYTVVEEDLPSYVESAEGYDLVNTYHPFGDLVLEKAVENQTSATTGDKFDFTVVLTTGEGEERMPIEGSFKYAITDEEKEISSGTLSSGDTVQLEAGQKCEVFEIPEYVDYEVTEAAREGYTTSIGNGTGQIRPNEDATVAVANTYHAETSVNLEAVKSLTGHAMSAYQYQFEVLDEEDRVVASAYNSRSGELSTLKDGNVYSEAPVTFGAIDYDQDDDGKTFVYKIREVAGDRGGVEYSKTLYTAKVTVTDNGDGTMGTKVVYLDEEDREIDSSKVLFSNVYTSSGSVDLTVFKQMENGELQDGEFDFELYRIDGAEDGSTSPVLIGIAKNDESGNVTFDPIVFDQTDAGKSFVYAVHEKTGTDERVSYDGHWTLLRVTTADDYRGKITSTVEYNADGLEVACWNHEDESCSICGGDEVVSNAETSYIFTNSYKPGELKISKSITDASEGYDPLQPFTFMVYTGSADGEEPDDGNPDDGGSAEPTEPDNPNPGDNDQKNEEPWYVDSDKVLHIVGPVSYTPGYYNIPWYSKRSDVVAVKIEPDASIETTDWSNLFNGFEKCTSFEGLENLDSSKVTNMSNLFSGAKAVTSLDVSGLDTSNVTNMSGMFSSCSSLTSLNLDGVNTSNVTNMSSMFSGCTKLIDPGVSALDTSAVTSFSSMFYGCSSLERVDLSSFDTKSATSYSSLSSMFGSTPKLKSVTVSSDFANADSYAFGRSGLFTNGYLNSDYSTAYKDLSSLSTAIKNLTGQGLYERYAPVNDDGWYIDAAGVLHINGSLSTYAGGTPPWSNYASQIYSVEIEQGAAIPSANWSGLFSGLTNCSTVNGFENIDSSHVTDMSYLFSTSRNDSPSGFTHLYLSNLDTSNVKNMRGMFMGCKNLESLNLDNLDTGNVTNMGEMFYDCGSLKKLDASSLDTGNVTDMRSMFYQCNSLTELDVSGFDTSNVTDMSGMFQHCPQIASLDLSSFSTGNVKTMKNMFCNLTHVSGYSSQLASLNISNFDTSSVTDMSGMFSGCSSLTALDVSHFNTSNVTNMNEMFRYLGKVTELDVSGFDTSKVTNMGSMFWMCERLKALDVSNFNTSNVTNMREMFYSVGYYSYGSNIVLDVSGFDTSKVTNMYRMFYQCSRTSELDLSNFDTSNVTDMGNMLDGCSGLTSLDVSSFDTSKVTNMEGWANRLSKLIYLTTSSKFANSSRFNRTYLVDSSMGWIEQGTTEPVYNTIDLFKEAIQSQEQGEVVTYVRYREVTVSFDANGGTGSMEDQTFNIMEGATLSPNKFVRPGYIFTGWARPYYSTYQYFSDEQFIQGRYALDDQNTLYAQWKSVSEVEEVSPGVYKVTICGPNTATIPDLPANTGYRVYEQTPAGWTLVDSSNTSGTIAPDDTVTASFTNEHTPGKTSLAIPVTKLLDGQAASSSDGFSFTLYNEDKSVRQVASVSDGGSVEFDDIVYTSQDIGKTFRYTVSENAGDDESIVYDPSVKRYTVTVSDDGAGNPLPTVVEDQSDVLTFKNSHKSGRLAIAKTVNANEEQEFEFQVTLDGELYNGAYEIDDVEHVAQNGIVKIKGNKTAVIEAPHDARYSVTEVNIPNGWTQESASGTSGAIESVKTSNTAIANSYEARGSATITASKKMSNGAPIASDAYNFQLRDDSGKLVAEVPNRASDDSGEALIEFPLLSYTEPGEYKYTIVEVDEGAEGITYDRSTKNVTVTVTDNKDGTLASSVAFQGEDSTFTNSYETKSLSISKVALNEYHHGESFDIRVNMKLDGNSVSADGVSDGDVVSIQAGKTKTITGIPYGTVWSIEEVNIPAGWAQDSISVSSGTLTADASTTVTNSYSASGEVMLKASKTFDGKTPEAGAFTFHVLDDRGIRIASANNDANGNIDFAAIKYDLSDVGTHTYTIVEDNSQREDIYYDDSLVTAEVTVSDNGDGTLETNVSYSGGFASFENFTASKLAKTGGMGVGLAGVMTLVVGGLWLVAHRRRRREAE